jgi:hypothetical protein
MNEFLDSVSNREIAITIWLIEALVACLFSNSIRKSLCNLLKILFSRRISASIFALYLHTGFYILILYKIGFWNIRLLKDTIVWTLCFGFISLMKINKINDSEYFKNIFNEAIKWTIGIEFIINFFSFSLMK